MAALNLNAFTENASRLGMRLQETLLENTRDLGIRGAGSTYLDNTEEKVKNIGKQLDSNSDREKLEAMKRLIAVRLRARRCILRGLNNIRANAVDLQRAQRLRVLRPGRQERRVPQPRDPQAGVYLSATLCGG